MKVIAGTQRDAKNYLITKVPRFLRALCVFLWEVINQISSQTTESALWILTSGGCVVQGTGYSSADRREIGLCPQISNDWTLLLQTLQINDTHTCFLTHKCARRHMHTCCSPRTPPPSCSDIWRTAACRESWFWEVRWGGGLPGWGCEVNNTSRVQRACLMRSLALAAPLGSAAWWQAVWRKSHTVG